MGTKAKTWVRVSPKAEAKDTRARRIYHLKANISPKVQYIMPTRAVPLSKVKGNQKAIAHIRPFGQISQPHQHIHKSLQSTQAVKAHLRRQPRPHHQYAVTFAIKLVIIRTIAGSSRLYATLRHINQSYRKHQGHNSSMIISRMRSLLQRSAPPHLAQIRTVMGTTAIPSFRKKTFKQRKRISMSIYSHRLKTLSLTGMLTVRLP